MKYQLVVSGVLMAILTGCATKPIYQKPIITKNAKGIPSHHLVQQGDTVSQIANRYGLNWRDVAQLNRLDDNYTIYAGQWLMLWQGASRNTTRTAPTTQALNTPASTRITIVRSPSQNLPQTQAIQPVPQTLQSPTRINTPSDAGVFIYPVNKNTSVVREFGTVRQINGANVKAEGTWFSGKDGDPVSASGAGTVIYADANSMPDASIAIRHADGFITEYRFIKDATVKAGQNVQAGQPIASMKNTNGVVVMEFRVAKNHVYLDPKTVIK